MSRGNARLLAWAAVLPVLGLCACGRGGFDPDLEAVDYRVAIPRLGGRPSVDGLREAALPPQPLVPVGWWGVGSAPDVSVEYAVSWVPTGLYFHVDVSDPGVFPAPPDVPREVYCGDSVELYVDADGEVSRELDEPGAVQLAIRAPEGSAPSQIASLYTNAYIGPWDGTFLAVRTRTGYAVEALVGAPDLGLAEWELGEGVTVGMDISLNVSTADGGPGQCGVRAGQFYLRVSGINEGSCNGDPWCDARAFAVVELR